MRQFAIVVFALGILGCASLEPAPPDASVAGDSIPRIRASRKMDKPPKWAELERTLIDEMNAAVDPVLETYVREDGTAQYRGRAV
ncbi:MAG: hypothetical protein ACLFWL_18480 [Candidatus Brocadiia bacterium]